MIQQMAMELKMKREKKQRATWLWTSADYKNYIFLYFNKSAFWNNFWKGETLFFIKSGIAELSALYSPQPYNGWTFQLKQFTSRNFQTIRPTFKIEPDFFSQISALQPSPVLEHDINTTTLICVAQGFVNPWLRGKRVHQNIDMDGKCLDVKQ